MSDFGEAFRPDGDNFNLSCLGVGWSLELLELDLGQCTGVACCMTYYVGDFTESTRNPGKQSQYISSNLSVIIQETICVYPPLLHIHM